MQRNVILYPLNAAFCKFTVTVYLYTYEVQRYREPLGLFVIMFDQRHTQLYNVHYLFAFL